MTAVAVLGERIVDLVPEGEPNVYRAIAGGSPANVALGLARLGVTPLMLARSGGDGFARLLDNHLVANGLPTDAVLHVGGPSALAVVDRQADGSAKYDFWLDAAPDFAWTAKDLDDALAIVRGLGAAAWHTGSLASYAGGSCETVLAAYQQAHAAGDLVLSYDPNARPGMAPVDVMRTRVEAFVSAADVVKVSDEDLAHLYPGEDPGSVCERWLASGPVLVVLTMGGEGVRAWRAGHPVLQAVGPKVVVSDTVGAGDTLSAALLSGLADAGALRPRDEGAIAALSDEALQTILFRACVAAGITCSRAGANPPTKAEVDAVA